MAKQIWKPGNMLYPLPVVLVTVRGRDGRDNVLTVAWAGTVCTNPPMLSVSVRPERYSHRLLCETGEFGVNLTTEALTWATDYCGVKSGRDVDKFAAAKLHKRDGLKIQAPLIEESPVNIECKVKDILHLGSHDLFLADVKAVHADERYMDKNKKFDLSMARPIVYSHGEYFALGKKCGTFGYSVRRNGKKRGK
ncbi:MAG TPA: flavin reductase family protein [Lachnospiraceae bacterium]|nr:flavin reductase family protein [Lachnospiraceae bacterium]